MRFFFVGFMGSGKSTFGNQLSEHLGVNFFDLDYYIEQKYQYSISDIFENQGEIYFRKIEHEALLEIIHKSSSFILSTGGGTPCFHNNMQIMLDNGIVTYLKVPLETILKRLSSSKKQRPLIENKTQEELKAWIEKTLSHRELYYNKAHIIIDSLNLKPKTFINYIKHLNILPNTLQ